MMKSSDGGTPEPRQKTWKLVATSDEEDPRCDFVRQWLRAHNWSANPEYMEKWQEPANAPQPVILFAEAEDTILGGLLAVTQFAWLKVSITAVHPDHRGRGIGSALMAEAERLARTRGCRHAYVDTMEYQALPFYTSRGFKIAGEIADWDSLGHAKYFLTKPLEPHSHED